VLVRHVDGRTFFHQGELPPLPGAVHRVSISRADGSPGLRAWVDSIEGLLGLVDVGAVEIHPWAAKISDYRHPDTMIFDLDPGPGVEWHFITESALRLREFLSAEGFQSWPKFTGGRGIHVMCPIEPALTHAQVYAFAVDLATRFSASRPGRYTAIEDKALRAGKVLLDVKRNGHNQTAIGAYSPRALPGLPVALPMTWNNVASSIRPTLFVPRVDGGGRPRSGGGGGPTRRRTTRASADPDSSNTAS
jgi:bifunctional non-homologous end joining protein LigD